MTMTVPNRKRQASLLNATSTTETSGARSDVASVFTGLPGGVIDGGEIVLLAIKPSMWRPLFESANWLIAGCLLAGILATLAQPIPGLTMLSTVQVLLAVGFGRLGVALAQWAPHWHVLTNRRIIDVCGVRSLRISSCPLVDIRNTYVRRSAPERLNGVGTILFVTTETTATPHAWRSIAEPDAVHAKIRRAIENAIDAHVG